MLAGVLLAITFSITAARSQKETLPKILPGKCPTPALQRNFKPEEV